MSQSEYATAARTIDGSTVVVYIPSVRPVTINLSVLKQPAIATWFDPSCGTYRAIPGKLIANSGTQFTAPGKNCSGDGDWVLLLTASRKP
jgi:hypothetical protein